MGVADGAHVGSLSHVLRLRMADLNSPRPAATIGGSAGGSALLAIGGSGPAPRSERAVDDLQWADPAVVDFLEGALDFVEHAPNLLCLVFRPDPDAPVWPLKERAALEVPDRYSAEASRV